MQTGTPQDALAPYPFLAV